MTEKNNKKDSPANKGRAKAGAHAAVKVKAEPRRRESASRTKPAAPPEEQAAAVEQPVAVEQPWVPESTPAPRRDSPSERDAYLANTFSQDASPSQDDAASLDDAADEAPVKPAPKKKKKKKKKSGKPSGEPPAPPKKPSRFLKRLRITVILLLLAVVFLAAGITVWARRISTSPVNMPNVFIGGIDVSGLTREQTVAALDAQDWDKSANEKLTVSLPLGTSFQVDLCKSGAMLTKEAAVDAACRYGHSGNWFDDLRVYLVNMLHPVDMAETERRIDDDYIRSCAEEGIAKFKENTAGDGGYEVDEEASLLRLVKGEGQMDIDASLLTKEVRMALLNGRREYSYDHIDNQLAMPNFEEIYSELAVETQDAHFVEGGFDVVDEVVGCSFDVDKAKEAWIDAAPGETVEIPIDITQPKVTGDELRSLLFRDKLGSQTTYFKTSTSNRITNIKLASGKLNEYVMLPGDEFSYNGVVGERTAEGGYKEADAYSNGEVVTTVGGGVCQVSSTLYCAARYANLEITARTNHYFKVTYLDWSLDATVSWPDLDFKFKNNREYPIKILTYVDEGEKSLTIEIWGTDVDGTYVEFRHSRYGVFDQEYPDTLIGWGVQAYRQIYDADGNMIEEIKEPFGYSSYFLHDYEIDWPPEHDAPAASTGGGGGGGGDTGGGDTGGGGGDTGGGGGAVEDDPYAG